MNKSILKGILFVSLIFNGVFLYIIAERGDIRDPQDTDTSSDTTISTNLPEVYESGKSYPLMRIVDGDTMVVGFDNKTQYVRLIGINSPEPNDPGGPQCYAEESTKHLQEIAKTGVVVLQFDESQGMHDSYGRLLAYVELPDGTDLAKKMIEDGYAHEYTYKAKYARQEDYNLAQDEAMKEERGLWSPDTCANN